MATGDQLKLDDIGAAVEFNIRVGVGEPLDVASEDMGRSAAVLLKAEMQKPYVPMLDGFVDGTVPRDAGRHMAVFWDRLVTGDDPVRQRMIFALSQIVVASSVDDNDPLPNAYYVDILGRHAFGNYRDILRDVTYSPKMATYLTYLGNRKGDPRTGRRPDENYAREILQLFSIGLLELNMDGTLKLQNGAPVETYTIDDVVGLARVFTGLNYATGDDTRFHTPLEMRERDHSELEKRFLGSTIAAGTPGDASIEQAIDIIFAHPNVAPYVSRQLIQRFTQSSPNRGYVSRVATAFETGRFTSADGVDFGTGERGDLEATLAAVLLDAQFFDDVPAGSAQGKVREPVLRFAQWARSMGVTDIDSFNEFDLMFGVDSNALLSQAPFRSPTVFNFYRPGFVPPGSEAGARGLTVPELQLMNEGATVGYNNIMYNFVFDNTSRRDGGRATYAAEFPAQVALADDPAALADHLDLALLGGRMEPATRQTLLDILSEVDIRTESEAEDRLTRARLAIYVAVTSPEYSVQY